MEVYPSLVECIRNKSPSDTRRIYRVKHPHWVDSNGLVERYVIATSPAQAALALIGEDNVQIVGIQERYIAMQQALDEVQAEHNAKVAKGGAK